MAPREEHKAVRDYKEGIPIELIAERLGRSIFATRLRVFGGSASGRIGIEEILRSEIEDPILQGCVILIIAIMAVTTVALIVAELLD